MNKGSPEKITNEFQTPERPPEVGGFPFWLPWVLAACLGAICIVLMTQGQGVGHQNTALSQEVEALNQQAKMLRLENETLKKRLEALK